MSARETVQPKQSDAAIVADIIAQLERGGPLNEPRTHADHDRTVSLANCLRREVRRSIDRVRLLDTYNKRTRHNVVGSTPGNLPPVSNAVLTFTSARTLPRCSTMSAFDP
jgi:hypothetical protein